MPTPRRGHRDNRRTGRPISSGARSEIVPHIAGETNLERHQRRLRTNLEHKDEVEAWCVAHGWQLTVSEEGHYWDFRHGGTYCQWRPAHHQFYVSRRLVANRDVLDYQQAIAMLAQYTRE